MARGMKRRRSRKKSTRTRARRKLRYAPTRARGRYTGVPSGIPRVRRTRMRYCDSMVLTSTTGSLASYVFCANGMFDPNITGVGHQPMGYDQMSGSFNHYCVSGAKITVTQNSANSGAGNPTIMGVYLTDSTSVPYSSWQEFKEANKGSSKVIQGGNTRPVTVTSKFSAKKFYNIADLKDNFQRLGAANDANPTEKALFTIWFQTLNGTSATYAFNVTIEYIAHWGEPRDINQS